MFGSTARGQASCGSDVDLIFAPTNPSTFAATPRLEQLLAELLQCRVDLRPRDRLTSNVLSEADRDAIPFTRCTLKWDGDERDPFTRAQLSGTTVVGGDPPSQ
jgi:predicted nucleotidyltransferase